MLYRYERVIELLGISRTMLYDELIGKGLLHVVYVGPRSPRIARSELERYVAALTETRSKPDSPACNCGSHEEAS